MVALTGKRHLAICIVRRKCAGKIGLKCCSSLFSGRPVNARHRRYISEACKLVQVIGNCGIRLFSVGLVGLRCIGAHVLHAPVQCMMMKRKKISNKGGLICGAYAVGISKKECNMVSVKVTID